MEESPKQTDSDKNPTLGQPDKNLGGRPSKVDEFAPQDYKTVIKLAALGLTDKQLSEYFEVSEPTLNAWKKRDPKFFKSLKAGKRIADHKVKLALFHRATGYSHPEEKIFNNNGTIVTHNTIKHYPPDPTSMIFWLKNREPDRWRDKQQVALTLGDELLEMMKVLPSDYAVKISAAVAKLTGSKQQIEGG